MRIAYFSHYFTPEIGAPSARIHDFARQWLSMGHEVQVITCFPNHPTGRLYPGYQSGLRMHEDIDGIQVYRNWTYITPNKGLLKKTIGHVSFWPSASILTNHRLAKPDIAIGTSPTFFAAMSAAALSRRRRIPFVMEVRDLWPAIFVELGVLRNRILIRCLEKWELALYGRAAHIVTVTESFRTSLISRGIRSEKVSTVLNGADVDFWRPAEAKPGLRSRLGLEDKFVVTYLGAHGISHALGKILDSARLLSDQSRIRFLFVGEGAEKESLVRQANEEQLPNVQFLDPAGKDAVRDYYALSDVCLVPLRAIPLFETFIPSKMFEIMATGRPMIASVRGEAAEILKQSGAAVIVEPEDSRAIADAVRHLHNCPEQARAMGRRGRDFVVQNYSRQALATRYLEVLRRAIAEFTRRRHP